MKPTADDADWGRKYGIFSTIFSLAVLLPAIAVDVRRFHDRAWAAGGISWP